MVALAAAGAPAVFAELPKAAPAKVVPAHSVFVMPSSSRDGRDPFYPESQRPYEEAVVQVAKPHTVDVASFTITGHSVENGHEMVIINKHTFAVGDEGEVMTSAGRVHVRLVEIHGNVAVVEANGGRREIAISNKQN